MIRVGKKWEKGAIYVGRGSPLGNPFPMSGEEERDYVCDSYEVWIQDKIATGYKPVLNELARLTVLSQKGDLILGCFCAPKRCHADTIKKLVEEGKFGG